MLLRLKWTKSLLSTFDLFGPAHHNVYCFVTCTTARTPTLVVRSVEDIVRAPKLPKMARFGLDAWGACIRPSTARAFLQSWLETIRSSAKSGAIAVFCKLHPVTHPWVVEPPASGVCGEHESNTALASSLYFTELGGL